MPGAPHAVMLASSLPGAPVARSGRSDGFARLLDDDTSPAASEPAETTAATSGTGHSGRTRIAAMELPPETPAGAALPTQTAAKKPAATDRGRQKSPPTRATTDTRKPSHDATPDLVSAGTTIQPDPSPLPSAALPDPALPTAPTLPGGTRGVTATDQPRHAPALSALPDAPAEPTKHEPHQATAAATPEARVANALPQPTDAPGPTATQAAAIAPAAGIPVPAATHAATQPPKADPALRANAPSGGPSPAPAAAPAVTAIPVAAHIVSPQHLIIHLTPPELGKLEVRIDRPADAPARVEIKVEHAHTLDLLSHDQPRLQQALDQAGVPANRHLVLTLSDGGSGSGGSQSDGRAAFATRRGLEASGSGVTETEPPDESRWARSALDITA